MPPSAPEQVPTIQLFPAAGAEVDGEAGAEVDGEAGAEANADTYVDADAACGPGAGADVDASADVLRMLVRVYSENRIHLLLMLLAWC